MNDPKEEKVQLNLTASALLDILHLITDDNDSYFHKRLFYTRELFKIFDKTELGKQRFAMLDDKVVPFPNSKKA